MVKGASFLKTLSIIVVVLAILSVTMDSITKYNENVRKESQKILREERSKLTRDSGEVSFGVYGDYGDDRPWMRLAVTLLSLFSFLGLWKSTNLLFSTVLTGISFSIYLLWTFRTVNALSIDWNLYSDRSLEEILLLAANPIDYTAFAAVTVLLFWQMFRLCRPHSANAPDISFP